MVWKVDHEIDLEKSTIRFGGQLAKSFYRYGTPVVPVTALRKLDTDEYDVGHAFREAP